MTARAEAERIAAAIEAVLDRISNTLDAAERIINASPFWDERSLYAGKALLDYPRSQIAAERLEVRAALKGMK